MSAGSWSGLRTMTIGTSGGDQPAQPGGELRRAAGSTTEPGMCPAAKSATGRTSTTMAPSAEQPAHLAARRAAASVGGPVTTAGRAG